MTEKSGEVVDDSLHSDLLTIMKNNQERINNAYPDGSFAGLFWEEQLKAASLSDSRQMKWHPVMIKWCLNLKLISGASYHATRSSNFIKLPSERTLRDYTNYFDNKAGFQNEQLSDEVEQLNLPENRKYFGLLVDEMKVKEGLVYNKHTGKIIGFTALGDINDTLMKIEQGDERPVVSKYLLALMVRGTLSSFNFPYAHFGTLGVTADMLFPIVDEAIFRLESRGLKVISITADGASPNRKMFQLFSSQHTLLPVPYKTPNVYSADGERYIFFFVDPPHLIKTTRNCWANSGPNGTRHMQVNGKFIAWNRMWSLYLRVQLMAERSNGISLLPKLKLEHVKLTSFSKMRVDLAAQVLSETVKNAFQYFGEESKSETQKFVSYFDKFFDSLNVKSLDEWSRKKKPFLKP